MSSSRAPSDVVALAPVNLSRAWAVLGVVFIADVMDVLDTTIANLAGPSIRADVGGAESTLQWVLAAYTTTFAIGLVASGRLGDILGRRRLFLGGMVGFTLASLACGLAPGVGWLITARALQGLTGSVMIPQGLALVTVVFPAEHLRRALIPIGPVMGAVTVAGPILAGWLLHLNLFGSQWRAIFLINVPIGVVAAILACLVLPHRAGEDPHMRIDPAGIGLITVASLMLIVPLVQGREQGWPLWTHLMLVGAVAALALFVVSERRGRHPVIPPTLLRRRGFVVGLLITGAVFASFTAFQLAFNLLLQLGLHWTPLRTGLALIPWALGTAVGMGLAGAVLTDRFGRATVQIGLVIGAAGLLGLWWTVAHDQGALTLWSCTPSLLLIGLGSGLVFIPIFDYILGDASSDEVGVGSGLLNAVQQFANAIGFAALGTVFFATAGAGGLTAYVAATQLVLGLAAGLYLVTVFLVRLLPEHAQHAGH
ncbi:MFS transporter [Pseudonocardia spinosispora]|uniref:MFS transporter n=1 Tax=Pseudonocardia spinosispora TaxID=103441 RepID=UPI00068692A4|nr:MFS transporter [Pseudonocardia spinosispora]